jgi:hypothetical protein
MNSRDFSQRRCGMPAEVIQVLLLYLVAVGGLSLWLYRRGADLEKKIRERVKER